MTVAFFFAPLKKVWDQLQDMYQLRCLWQDGSSWCIAPFQVPSISCHQIQKQQRLLPNSSIATSFDCWVVRDQSGFKWTCLGRKNQGLKQDQFILRKKKAEISSSTTGVLKSVMVYCHTLMEIGAVFIGYLCNIPIPHRNSRFEATNYSSKLRCLEDFVYDLVWKACVTGRYLLKTWCLPVFFSSPPISLKGIQTGLFFDIIQNFSSSTWCHFLNPYKNVNEYRIDTFPPILTRPTAGVTLSWWKSWKAKSHCAPQRCSQTGQFCWRLFERYL